MANKKSNNSLEQEIVAKENKQKSSPDPTSPAFRKKLDGPNRPAE